MPRIHERRAVSGRGKDLRDFSSMDPIGKLEARRAMQDIAVPQRIAESPHKSALIPYVVRALVDHYEDRQLTSLQRRVIEPLIRAGLDRKVLRRFDGFSRTVRDAFDNSYFTTDAAAEVDKLFLNHIKGASNKIIQEIAGKPRDAYRLTGGFHQVVIPAGFAHKAMQFPARQDPAEGYHFRLEYRGVKIIKGHDRYGGDGPDPYLLAGFYLQDSPSGLLNELAGPFKIKHIPPDLPEHGPDEWSPRGGAEDANKNPVSPSQIFPKITQIVAVSLPDGSTVQVPVSGFLCGLEETTPLLYTNHSHCAIISVWEEDGDQAQQLLGYFGDLVLRVVAALATNIPGLVFTAIGLVWDLIIGCLADSADDPIEDIALFFDKEELEKGSYREIEARVRRPSEEECARQLAQYNARLYIDNAQRRMLGLPPLPELTSWPYNEWVLYFGVESKKA